MTLEELKTLLDETKIPVSYSSVPLEEKDRPYICFYQGQDRNFAADGIVYYARKVVTVNLYTDKREMATEAVVEAELQDMYYTKSIEFLEDQKIYEITYEIEV